MAKKFMNSKHLSVSSSPMRESASSQRLLSVMMANDSHSSNRSSMSNESSCDLLMVAVHNVEKKKPDNSGTTTVINPDTEDEMHVTGYKHVGWKSALVWIGILLTVGLFKLVLYWLPHIELKLTHRKCHLREATSVLIKDEYKANYSRYYVKPIYKRTKASASEEFFEIPASDRFGFNQVRSYRFFRCQKIPYLWCEETEDFYPNHGLDFKTELKDFHEQEGLSEHVQNARRAHYGLNVIMVPLDSILKLMFKQILNPFYVFQVFSVCLWYSDEYVAYATAIVIMSAGGITASIYQTRKNQKNLRNTIHITDRVSVFRQGTSKSEEESTGINSSHSIDKKSPPDKKKSSDTEMKIKFDTKQNGVSLHNATFNAANKIEPSSPDADFEAVSSDQLVPGDIIEIPPHGCELHCDAVLISGTAIVNEAMLTGESVPVTKTMIPKHRSDAYNPVEHSRNTLFCGTKVIQTRNYARQRVLAVVIRTGFLTSKGRLVQSIMYPAPVDFKFEQDSYKFIGFLASIAVTGFIYTCVLLYKDGYTISEIALEALDLITIVIPPALPAAMTIGSIYAQSRLQKKGIFCISPRTINQTGSVDCICFDKTGTLTEDGLDLWGVVPVAEEGAESPTFEGPEQKPRKLKSNKELIQGMSVCHSLTVIDGELTGDPLDIKMFEATNWILEEPTDDTSEQFDNLQSTRVKSSVNDEEAIEIGIIRQFPFSSNRQCQSVVTRKLDQRHFTVYCKGSPEKISSISKSESIPLDFHRILESYTEKGYRVIAMAKRDLDPSLKIPKIQRMERDDVENNLTFLGLIVFENRLKEASTPIIAELQRANLRTIMITGDNINTALSVARECGMIKGRVIQAMTTTGSDSSRKPALKFVAHTIGSSLTRAQEPAIKNGGGLKVKNIFKKEDTALEMEKTYQIAVDGRNFDVIRDEYEDIFDRICVKGAVFARMSPEQKQILIEHLQHLGYYVAMCGDGANDCGALKAAHAGISLSEAESSVASPFTSKEPNISCVPQLIREGRCALVTSFGVFKYMAAYSLTQFVSVIILYHINSNLSDFEFLYIDLFLITVFAFFFGLTEAYDGPLASHAPMKSLISLAPLVSLALQMIAIVFFQLAGLFYTKQQDWFVPFDRNNPTYNGTKWESYYEETTIEDSEVACWENYAVFSISAFQYIILAYAFSKSHPYRKWIITNVWLIGSLIVLTGFTIYVVLDPSKWIQALFELMLPPEFSFRLIIFGIAAVNVVICVLIEDVFVEYCIFRGLKNFWAKHVKRTNRLFLKIQNELRHEASSWPPVTPDHNTWPSQASLNTSSNGELKDVHRTVELEMEVMKSEAEAFKAFEPSYHQKTN